MTIEMDDKMLLQWWIDASFAVHQDMRSHTGAIFMIGKGAMVVLLNKQKINADSSTVAELIGVHDALLPLIIWSRYFLMAQGQLVLDTLVHQDNQSAMLLERNGRSSCGRRARHINEQTCNKEGNDIAKQDYNRQWE